MIRTQTQSRSISHFQVSPFHGFDEGGGAAHRLVAEGIAEGAPTILKQNEMNII